MMTERFCICILCVNNLIPFLSRSSSKHLGSRFLAALRTRDRFPYPPLTLSSSLRVGKYFQIPMSHSIPLCSILYIDLSFLLFKTWVTVPLRFVTIRLTNLLSSSFNYSYSSEQSVTVTIIYKSLDLNHVTEQF